MEGSPTAGQQILAKMFRSLHATVEDIFQEHDQPGSATRLWAPSYITWILNTLHKDLIFEHILELELIL